MGRPWIVGLLLLVLFLGLGLGWWANRWSSPQPVLTAQIAVAPDHIITTSLLSNQPRMLLLRNFLTPDECDQVIQLGESLLLTRSTVQGPASNEISAERTSYTLNFRRHHNALITALEQRATLFCPYPADHVENLQLVRYHPGQQYKHHYDFFVPGAPGTPVALQRGGQRHVTLFVYLNDLLPDDPGGHTDFPRLPLRLRPEKGLAVLWYNVDPVTRQEDFRTFHAGLPPQRSVKYGLNLWIRERPFV